jgi:hypothetical protein
VPGKIFIMQGNIWEGGMDLTVLPCSSKKTIKTARTAVEQFGLIEPAKIRGVLKLGGVTRLLKFPGDPSKTKYYTWAAAVFNDASSEEALESIGGHLGTITRKNSRIRNVEAPLLGTGAGKLSNEQSAKSLARGFSQTSHDNSSLYIFAWDYERFRALSKSLSKDKWDEVLDSIEVKPGVFGISLDLKKLLLKQRKS